MGILIQALCLMINKDIGGSGRINENDLRISFHDSDDEIIIEVTTPMIKVTRR